MVTKTSKDDAGQAEVQQKFDEELAKGYSGDKPRLDAGDYPNENYTLAGVTSGKPTPETERKHPDKAKK